MADARISSKIIEAIREAAAEEPILQHFLLELLYVEAEHPSQWWWKDPYRQKLMEYSSRSVDANENQ